MGTLTKSEISGALVVLLDIENEDKKELEKLKVDTLKRIFEGIKKNALEYQNMYELYRAAVKSK